MSLPREVYLDPSSYTEYVDAYKKYIVDVARVMSRELGTAVPDPELQAQADNIFDFEIQIAQVKDVFEF